MIRPILFSFLVFSSLLLVSWCELIALPIQSNQKSDTAVTEAAKAAEVHVIGVYRPENATITKISNLLDITESLRQPKGFVAKVFELLSERTQKLINSEGILDKVAKLEANQLSDLDVLLDAIRLKQSLTRDLDSMLDRNNSFKLDDFKDIALSKSLKDLIELGDERTVLQTAQMNWGILNAIFPKSVSEPPTNFRTIKVRVLAGKDVVLVLSSYGMCRWIVDLKDGGQVVGVVLCGYHGQEVVGVGAAPVAYHAYHELNGRRRDPKQSDCFYGYNETKGESWKPFMAGIKSVTGKEPTTFQGGDSPGPEVEHFIIRPDKK